MHTCYGNLKVNDDGYLVCAKCEMVVARYQHEVIIEEGSIFYLEEDGTLSVNCPGCN